MCTVTYVVSENGFVLTTNRDEDPQREALPPEQWSGNKGAVFTAPRDAEKNGTWCAVDDGGRVACVLNGAFEKHDRNPPYRESRGVLIPRAFASSDFFEFCTQTDFTGFEPFTLVLIDEFIQELRWDGEGKCLQFLSKQCPHLWSSAPLYTNKEHQEKLSAFHEFLDEEEKSDPDAILQLHGLHTPNNFILDLPYVKTVSITQVEVKKDGNSRMRYFKPKKNSIHESL